MNKPRIFVHELDGSVTEAFEFPKPAAVKVMNKTYAYHKPSPVGVERISSIRRLFTLTHDAVVTACPQSRELSVALTNLEQAAMWAVKAIIVNDPESQVQD